MSRPKRAQPRFTHHVDVLGGRLWYNTKRVGDRSVQVEALFAVPGVPASLQLRGVLETAVVVRDTTGMLTQAAEAFKQVAKLFTLGDQAQEAPSTTPKRSA